MTFTGISIWTMLALLVGSATLLALLHRLRIRPQTVWVNTTLFWHQALRRTRARSLWERFRHPLTYLLLLLIAALMIIALADPRPSLNSHDQEHTVFVLDLSSSMSVASPDSPTRLALAKEKLLELVDQFTWPNRFAVITTGPQPRLIHAMGDLRPMLTHRLKSLNATPMPTDRQHAVRLAASLLEGHQHPNVCLITDRPFDGFGNESKGDRNNKGSKDNAKDFPQCQVVQVGTPLSNAAILSAIFEPDQKNPLVGTLQVRAGVWPKGKATIKLTARREGGAVLAEKKLVVTENKKTVEKKAGSIVTFEVKQLAADGGTIQVEITGDDTLREDSVIRYRLPVRRPIRVLVENEMPTWLELLMKLDPTLVPSDSSDADVKLRVAASETLSRPTRVVAACPDKLLDTPAVTFEDLYCTASVPRDRFNSSIMPWITTADEHLIVALQPTAPCPTLWVADVAWSDDSPLIRSAAWPMLLRRAIRELADWQKTPLSLDPITVGQFPEIDTETIVTMPGNRAASDLTAVQQDKATSASTSFFTTSQAAWTEWLLLAALLLAIFEITLHTRGKIA